ncbi:uncharacterized protein LOC107426952 [Ziziphus jujuba]|uniref:Uncharacterized protein LOC107426952 n=1 Tax=Ziziphus jujuba TaxID=326968 RepID=A0A6P4A9L1_ZIZJJ|nr:uncharacterized protein LOC107426952 [Ziziphus jujuba]
MSRIVLQFLPVLLLMLMAMMEATPPGIAKNPSHSRCLIKKYKMCYNLEHVCPKFCPDACTVNCVSCKPMCVDSSSPAPEDSNSPPESPKTPTTPTSTPPPSNPTYPPSTPSPKPPSPSPSTPSTTTPASPSPPTQPKPTPPTPTEPSSPATTPSPPSSPTPPPTTPSSPSPPSNPATPPSTPLYPSPPPLNTTPSYPTPPSSTPSPPSKSPPSSNPPSTPSSPSASEGAKRAKCKNKNYPQCYDMEHVCPSSCPGGCEVDCVTCKPVCRCDQPGAVCQDPRFIGGDGITFYFHGKKDQDFCLLSDANLHINAHFIGRRNQNMKRDFTWVQSIGVLFGNHQLYIGAQKTAIWEDSVDRISITFDGKTIRLPESEGARWQSESVPSVFVMRAAETNDVMVEVEGSFRITAKVVPITEEDSQIHNYGITKEDSFAHLDLGFKFFSLSDQVSGVLGQTYRPDYVSRVNIGAKMAVMGGYMEFKTSSLFATDCAVAQFRGSNGEASLEDSELPSLSCTSGLDGQGVVCKK